MHKEFFGNSEQEALKKAEQSLGINADGLSYRVIATDLGQASQPKMTVIVVDYQPEDVRTEVAVSQPQESEAEKRARAAGGVSWAITLCDGIFRRMGIVTTTTALEREDSVILKVETENGETIDLRRGQNRDLRGALQHVINRAVNDHGREEGDKEPERRYILDIGGTLEARTEKLQQLGAALLEKLSQLSKPVYLHLMDSQDRRILHTALLTGEKVVTRGVGEKQFRILSVSPK